MQYRKHVPKFSDKFAAICLLNTQTVTLILVILKTAKLLSTYYFM